MIQYTNFLLQLNKERSAKLFYHSVESPGVSIPCVKVAPVMYRRQTRIDKQFMYLQLIKHILIINNQCLQKSRDTTPQTLYTV